MGKQFQGLAAVLNISGMASMYSFIIYEPNHTTSPMHHPYTTPARPNLPVNQDPNPAPPNQ